MDEASSKFDKEIEAEKKKISELYREIKSEGDKDDTKLQWMYKKPNELVDREEYLLGRTVDKAIDSKGDIASQDVSNIPERIIGSESKNDRYQIDLDRKIQEDPLYAIRQKEIEARKQLLKNPVKVKELRKMYEEQLERKKKAERRQMKRELASNIDYVILKLIKKLGDDFDLKSFLNDGMKKKKKKREKKSSSSSSSSPKEDQRSKVRKTEDDKSKRQRHRSPSTSPERQGKSYKHREYGLSTKEGSKRVDPSTNSGPYKPVEKKAKYVPPKPVKLNEKEIQAQLELMRKNAEIRKKERTAQLNKHVRQVEEEHATKEYKEDFIRKQVAALSSNSVSDRLKSNINNIQRSKSSMDSNFARR